MDSVDNVNSVGSVKNTLLDHVGNVKRTVSRVSTVWAMSRVLTEVTRNPLGSPLGSL